MKITEVRIKPVQSGIGAEKLRAWCAITFDSSFVIRDVKIIEGGEGLFLAMPSRRTTERCSGCGGKNHLRARFCNDCGKKLSGGAPDAGEGSRRVFVDIAHPINADMRRAIHDSVIRAFHEEVGESADAGDAGDRQSGENRDTTDGWGAGTDEASRDDTGSAND